MVMTKRLPTPLGIADPFGHCPDRKTLSRRGGTQLVWNGKKKEEREGRQGHGGPVTPRAAKPLKKAGMLFNNDFHRRRGG